MALIKGRLTPHRNAQDVNDPVAAGQKIYQGAIVMLDAAGNAIKGAVATGLTPRGVAQALVDNSAGIAGDETIAARKGCFRFKNDTSVARADIGGTAYVVDDETVAKTDGTGTRSALGEIIDVDASGVWVEIA
jgi:hypothetical protein